MTRGSVQKLSTHMDEQSPVNGQTVLNICTHTHDSRPTITQLLHCWWACLQRKVSSWSLPVNNFFPIHVLLVELKLKDRMDKWWKREAFSSFIYEHAACYFFSPLIALFNYQTCLIIAQSDPCGSLMYNKQLLLLHSINLNLWNGIHFLSHIWGW